MLKIKLSRTGKKSFATYNIIIAESRSKRDGRYIDLVGLYNPNTNPPTIKLDTKKITNWRQKGARPTQTVRRLINTYAKSG